MRFLVLLIIFTTVGFVSSESKLHRFTDDTWQSVNNSSQGLKTITTQAKGWKNVMSIIGQMPKSVMLKAKALYENGEMEKLKELSAALKRLKQLYLMQKCKAIFTADLCSNSSAQPFFIWAKMSANKMIQGRARAAFL